MFASLLPGSRVIGATQPAHNHAPVRYPVEVERRWNERPRYFGLGVAERFSNANPKSPAQLPPGCKPARARAHWPGGPEHTLLPCLYHERASESREKRVRPPFCRPHNRTVPQNHPQAHTNTKRTPPRPGHTHRNATAYSSTNGPYRLSRSVGHPPPNVGQKYGRKPDPLQSSGSSKVP